MGILKGSSIYNSFDAGGGGGFEDVSDQIDILITGTVELKAYKSGSIFIAFFKRKFSGSHTANRWINFFKIKDNSSFVFSDVSSNLLQCFNDTLATIRVGEFITISNGSVFPPPDYEERLVEIYSPYTNESFSGSFLANVKDI